MRTAGFRAVLAPIVGLLLLTPAGSGRADDVVLGSIRLRGGIDANPTLLPGVRPSAFAGLDGAFAVGREESGRNIGVVAEIERTDYARADLDPSERYRVVLKAEDTAFDDWALRSATSVEAVRSTTLHSSDVAQTVRAQRTGGPLRPFVAAEAHYTTLNETNAILVDFLPDDLRYAWFCFPARASRNGTRACLD